MPAFKIYMLNPRQIEVFRWTMSHGTATAAAMELGISQPAASRMLSELEEACGFVLFERRGNQLIPTPEAALRNCCYSNSGMAVVDQGVAQGAGGQWYACKRYR